MTTALVDQASALFAEFQDGRKDQLERLVHLLTPTLWHLARSCGLERADAEDVVQSAWLQLVDKAATIREPQAVLAWLGRTVRREAWRVRRLQGRRPTFAEAPETPDPTPEPGETVVLNEIQATLRRHFAELNPKCQALLRVISRGGPPDYASLADALGIPMGSIGPTRGRCLAKLRQALLADPTWSAT